jgi:arginase
MHTYTSTVSGNTHGTPLSVCVGLEKTHWASRLSLKQLGFDRLIYVGIRDIDDFEGDIIDKHNIKHYTPQQAIDWMRANKNLPIHISFDVDALDPTYVSSTGTRVEEGLHPHEVRSILAEGLDKGQLKSLDCVEFNQFIEGSDPEKSAKHVREVFRDFFPEEFPPENYL